MIRYLNLASFVLIGLFSAIALYMTQVFAVLEPLRSSCGGSPESWLWLAYYFLIPLSLFTGSGVTGYVSSPHIRTTFGFLCVSPGLYVSAIVAIHTVLNWGGIIRWYAVWMLQLQVLWFLASWAGVGVGHVIRRSLFPPP